VVELRGLVITVTVLANAGCRLFAIDGAACLEDVNCSDGQSCCQGECRDSCPHPPVCGDGELTGIEECDYGDGNADDSSCTTACRLARCGDGLEGPGEVCDDGNTADGDYCAADCSAVTAVCGDGEMQQAEECDDGNGNSDVTPNACRSDCTVPRCGDGVRDSGEACDSEDCCDPVGCTLRNGGTCRPAAGDCDVTESCDGLSLDCPVDEKVAAGTECRAVTGDCDVADNCDGVAAGCPLNVVVDAGMPCRPSAGPCDIGEECDGASPLCPADVRDDTSVCRSAAYECDAVEYCDGVLLLCPNDEPKPDLALCRGGRCQSGECIGIGLSGAYYDNRGLFGDPALVQIDPQVDFIWGAGQPAVGVGPDDFSVRWSGEVRADISGLYAFRTTSDDGVRLWVDDVLVIDDWSIQATTTNDGSITLVGPDRHSIILEYFELGNDAEIELRWRPPGSTRVVIPTSHLYPTSCGNDIVEMGEVCDGPCCDEYCFMLRVADSYCRPLDDECDLAERCDGITDTCPVDVRENDGTACSVGSCDLGYCLAATHFVQATGGNELVSIEAEHHDRRIPVGGHAWVQAGDGQASGGQAMRAEPVSGVVINLPWQDYSPRLDFKVRFNRSGSHVVWIRGLAVDAGQNSFTIGLDGVPATPYPGVEFAAGAWNWSDQAQGTASSSVTIDVTAGDHILNLWMREDGAAIDKIVLTPNSGYSPWAFGPIESTREAD